jgi:hypothetical protein
MIRRAGPTYVLNDMAVIADEEEGATVGQIELHSDQSWNERLVNGVQMWNEGCVTTTYHPYAQVDGVR